MQQFGCELPSESCREVAYPTYSAPFVYLKDGKPHCELAQLGMVPQWAPDKKKYGLRTYNARTETVQEKPTYKNAWKERRFGLVLMDKFYEPNWETGKAIRWGIERSDGQPCAAASIWERMVDKETGEVIMSFSMLTIGADGHDVMKHFHKLNEEKRSIVILKNMDLNLWLTSDSTNAKGLLNLSSENFLISYPELKG